MLEDVGDLLANYEALVVMLDSLCVIMLFGMLICYPLFFGCWCFVLLLTPMLAFETILSLDSLCSYLFESLKPFYLTNHQGKKNWNVTKL